MPLSIVDSCVNCWACHDVCPTNAISQGENHFLIDPKKCTECQGDHADTQCASICPIEGAILTKDGQPCNPAGSLTGIPPEKMEEAMREMQLR